MNEQERNGAFDVALLVHVMYVERCVTFDVDVAHEHGEFCVEGCFVDAPVVPVPPTCDETIDVCEGDAVFATCVLELVGEDGEREFGLEGGDGGGGDGDDERGLWVVGHGAR